MIVDHICNKFHNKNSVRLKRPVTCWLKQRLFLLIELLLYWLSTSCFAKEYERRSTVVMIYETLKRTIQASRCCLLYRRSSLWGFWRACGYGITLRSFMLMFSNNMPQEYFPALRNTADYFLEKVCMLRTFDRRWLPSASVDLSAWCIAPSVDGIAPGSWFYCYYTCDRPSFKVLDRRRMVHIHFGINTRY